MVFSYLNLAVLICLMAGAAFAIGPLVGSLLLAPKAKGGDMAMPYECGMPPQGSAWARFGINYYFYALLFLAFDVDVLYLFPAVTYYPQSVGWVPLVKVLIFLAALALGCIYFWKKGVFAWPRKTYSD